jgi:hypothetical protein
VASTSCGDDNHRPIKQRAHPPERGLDINRVKPDAAVGYIFRSLHTRRCSFSSLIIHVQSVELRNVNGSDPQ